MRASAAKRPGRAPRFAALPAPVRRLLTRGEAAAYCGLGASADLPVRPIRVRPGKQGLRYDVRELDRWIDSLRGEGDADERDDPFARLDRAESQRARRPGTQS